ncbi:hypothetical protein ACHAXN_007436 [Cyclotella atomus]
MDGARFHIETQTPHSSYSHRDNQDNFKAFALVKRNKMSFIGDKAEEAAEKQIFEAGGYGALFKYRAVKTWKKVTSCCCA